MRLYVPEIGDKLTLSKPWTFDLHFEHRNTKMLEHFGGAFNWRESKNPLKVTLETGTVLKVDRVYIRQGLTEFSSISFYAEIPGEPTKKGAPGKPSSKRFWAKLSDCNNIEFETVQLKDVSKLPLVWWNIPNESKKFVKTTQSLNVVGQHCDSKHIISAGKSYSNGTEEYRVRLEYQEKLTFIREDKIPAKRGSFGSMIGGYTNYYYDGVRDLKYTVTTMNGVHVGEYTSYTSMKKGVAEHYAQK